MITGWNHPKNTRFIVENTITGWHTISDAWSAGLQTTGHHHFILFISASCLKSFLHLASASCLKAFLHLAWKNCTVTTVFDSADASVTSPQNLYIQFLKTYLQNQSSPKTVSFDFGNKNTDSHLSARSNNAAWPSQEYEMVNNDMGVLHRDWTL